MTVAHGLLNSGDHAPSGVRELGLVQLDQVTLHSLQRVRGVPCLGESGVRSERECPERVALQQKNPQLLVGGTQVRINSSQHLPPHHSSYQCLEREND